jgi:hypothetical protein
VITHEIRKQKGVFGVIQNAFGRPPQQKDIPALVADLAHSRAMSTMPHVPSQDRTFAEEILGDKLRYNQWLNLVQEQWKKGDLVTLRIVAVVPDRKDPPPLFEINQFQEIRQLCQWDNIYKEPKAVGCIVLPQGGFTFFAPSALRQLTEQEKILVDLQHLQEQEQTPS